MRKVLATIAAALILASMSCSTTQPTTGGRQVVTVTASAFVLVDVWWIWDVWADVDRDGTPETPTPFPDTCVLTTSTANAPAPWPYSAELSLIEAGTTREIRLRSTASALDPFSNITPYDTTIRQTLPNVPPVVPGDIFWGVNGREVTAATRDYIESCTNLGPLFAASNILGEPVAVSVEVSQGDTIVFRARKQLDSQANPYAQIARSAVTLSTSYFLDGREVTPAGTTAVSSDGGGFTASVTIR